MTRRAIALAFAAVALAVTAATPVWAHTGSNAVENLRTEVTSVPDGLEAQVHGDGSLITVRASGPATVLGYEGEPFLRFVGERVYANAGSSTTHDARPELATGGTSAHVSWTPVDEPGWFAWSDHRVMWDGAELPKAVMDDPGHPHPVADWSIPVTVAGEAGVIAGRIAWEPPAGGQTLTMVVLLGVVVATIALAVWAAFSSRGVRDGAPDPR